MGNRLLNKKAQGSLESVISFVVMILLLWGIAQIWFWANGQIVKRQGEYNRTRQIAGFASDDYKMQWPLNYTKEELKEDDVLTDLE